MVCCMQEWLLSLDSYPSYLPWTNLKGFYPFEIFQCLEVGYGLTCQYVLVIPARNEVLKMLQTLYCVPFKYNAQFKVTAHTWAIFFSKK